MSVKDMIKKSVLESGAFTNYDVPNCSFVTFAPPFLVGLPAGFFVYID